jgi:hypothetical protein
MTGERVDAGANRKNLLASITGAQFRRRCLQDHRLIWIPAIKGIDFKEMPAYADTAIQSVFQGPF